jgi:hypothetical protein
VVRALDAALLETAGREIGAALRITNVVTYQAPDADPLTPLHTRAIGGTARPVARVAALDSYVASTVLADTAGEPVALLDALLPAASFAAMTRTYDRLLLLITCIVALLAGLAGLFGRWLAAPVPALADMAHRIGRATSRRRCRLRNCANSAARRGDGRHAPQPRGAHRGCRREAEARAVLAGVVEGVFVVDTASAALCEPAVPAHGGARRRAGPRPLLR